jgi:hypothetical protein
MSEEHRHDGADNDANDADQTRALPVFMDDERSHDSSWH